MKKKPCFFGVGTAVVTPFLDGKIDYSAFSKIIDMQISAGIDALIVGGTTGEAATLSDTEREALYAFAAEKIGGRVKFKRCFSNSALQTPLFINIKKIYKRY